MNNENSNLYAHVSYPGYCLCPACIGWMRMTGKSIGRNNCGVCHGKGRIPYTKISAAKIPLGRDLRIIENTPDSIAILTPYFGECRSKTIHFTAQAGSRVRCLGCEEMCFVPAPIGPDEKIITDPDYGTESNRKKSRGVK